MGSESTAHEVEGNRLKQKKLNRGHTPEPEIHSYDGS